jgi:hypothetical protein
MIGIAWTLGGVFCFLTMEGISTPISNRAVLLAAAAWFVGPTCLTMSLMLLFAASILATLILNGIVGDSMYDAFHPQPLQGSVPYSVLCPRNSSYIFCDLCVLWLGADWTLNRWKSGVNTSGA